METDFLALPDLDTGEAPPERLTDANKARDMWNRACYEDEDSSVNRAYINEQINGHPPFDQEERREDGQEDLFNVNTGNARMIIDEAVSGIMDVFASERELCDIPLDETMPESVRADARRKLEEEFSRMLHSWTPFNGRVNNLLKMHAAEGVGCLFFEDEDTWYFNTGGLRDFKFFREAEPVAGKIGVAMMTKNVRVGDLWRKIRNEKQAEKRGWDPDTVKQAIVDVASRNHDYEWRRWDAVEQQLKANELWVSRMSEYVKLLYMLIEEYDGSVSVYICSAENDSKAEGFLYKKRNAYKSMDQVLHIFPYTSGDNNLIYTVRGMGFFIYQACNAENVMFSRMMDTATVGSSFVFQAGSVEDMQDMSIVNDGFATIVPRGFNVPQNISPPNLQNTLVPALQTIRDSLNRVSGNLNEGPQAFGERANQDVVSVFLDQINKMASQALVLFYGPLDKVYREVVRRVFIANNDTEESKEMKKRLEKVGITEEIWKRIDLSKVKARRLVAGANKVGRQVVFNRMRQRYASMDEQGREDFDYSEAVEIVGRELADRWFGRPEVVRTTMDEQIAELEVNDLVEGHILEAKPGQDHLVHLRVKLDALKDPLTFSETGAMELTDMDEAEYAMRYYPIWKNASEHAAMLVVDPTMEEEVAELNRQLQNLREFIFNGMKQAQAQNQQNSGQSGDQEGQDSENDLKTEEFLREQARKDAAHEQDMRHKQETHQVDQAIKVAEKDAEMATKVRTA